jgi:hypothetical protein
VIHINVTVYHLLLLATLMPVVAWIHSWWIDDDDDL